MIAVACMSDESEEHIGVGALEQGMTSKEDQASVVTALEEEWEGREPAVCAAEAVAQWLESVGGASKLEGQVARTKAKAQGGSGLALPMALGAMLLAFAGFCIQTSSETQP
jgi:hypothetical protein